MSKYSVLYADPPWDYAGKTQHNGVSAVKSAEDHYPTMTLDQLKALKVTEKCDEDCLLFLWSSSPHLPQALDQTNLYHIYYLIQSINKFFNITCFKLSLTYLLPYNFLCLLYMR